MQATELISTGNLYRRSAKLMGNRFEFTVVADDEAAGHNAIELAIAEVSRIEQLLSTFKDNSQTNQINRQAGIGPVEVSPEVFELIARAQRISGITQGAFDLSYGSVDKSLWNFDLQMKALPSAATAAERVRLVNYRNILLDREKGTVMLKEKGMRIGFGGIGKGYAAEMVRRLLVKNGIKSGIVNASGDLSAWGRQPNGAAWTIGIADPENRQQAFSALVITDRAVATSGNYEKFVLIGGKKYSHTIDPKTGLPVHGISSVTIICSNAEIADAMATPVMIMGVKAGLHLINQLNGIECIIIDDHQKVYTSSSIRLK